MRKRACVSRPVLDTTCALQRDPVPDQAESVPASRQIDQAPNGADPHVCPSRRLRTGLALRGGRRADREPAQCLYLAGSTVHPDYQSMGQPPVSYLDLTDRDSRYAEYSKHT